MRPAVTVALVLAAVTARAADIDPDDLRPGLVATHADGTTKIVRLEPGVAVNLKAGEATHPRLKPTGSVTWAGYVNVLRAGPYTFTADVTATATITVDGRAVPLGTPTELKDGLRPIRVTFTRTGGLAKFALRWAGPGFRSEPLPVESLYHLPAERPAEVAAHAAHENGRFLWEEKGCQNCHAVTDASLVKRVGPNLTKVGGRVHAGWLDRWLSDPQRLRPATAMPKLFPDDATGAAERYAVGQYLQSLGGPVKAKPPEKDAKASVSRGQAAFAAVGCVVCHPSGNVKPAATKDELSFYGGSRPYPLGSVGSKTTPDALAAYLKDPLAVNPSGRMPNMLLADKEAKDIATYLCERTEPFAAPADPGEQPLKALWQREGGKGNASWKAVGKLLTASKGCANCHAFDRDPPAATTAAPFAACRDHADRGCLSDAPSGKAANYVLSTPDRRDLQAFLRDGSTGAGSPAPTHAARVAFRRFNCLACHQRDGEGGIAGATLDELRKYEKAENAEGLTPPSLTGVGGKLLTQAVEGVLTRGQRARPWMGLRMPQYGAANVGFLGEALARCEGQDPETQPHAPAATAAQTTAGRQLIGKSGFGCVACHDYAGIANSGTRGPDLTRSKDRLRYDWYRRWLEQPQRMQPGTRMPQVFPDGKSVLTETLGGHADAQAVALWAYAALGSGAALPDGLEVPKGLVLKPAEKPVLLRAFLPDIGSARGFAVGYPNGMALAFDADAGRLAYAWAGNFLDAGPVWEQRGGQMAKLLGPRYWAAPPGPAWFLSASQTPPDFAARTADPNSKGQSPEGKVYDGPRPVKFAGYTLDAAGRPTFRYEVPAGANTLTVEERPEPVRVGLAQGVARHFNATVPAGHAGWLIAATGSDTPRAVGTGKPAPAVVEPHTELPVGPVIVVPQPTGRPLAVTVRGAPAGSVWLAQKQASGWAVLLKLPASAPAVRVSVFALPSEDSELLTELAREQ